MPVEPHLITSPHWEKAVASLILALIIMLFYGAARTIIKGHFKDTQSRNHWNKAANLALLLTSIPLLACIWLAAIRPAVTFLVILAAAMAIVLKTAIMSLSGGLLITWRGLFSVGDRIRVGAHRGDVIGTGPFYFTLFEVGDAASGHQSTGRVLKIPNNLILSSPIVNHSKFFPYVWNELSIVLKSNANWVKAKSIFQQLTEKYTKAYEGSALAAMQNAKKKSPIIIHKTSPKIYVTLRHERPAGIKLTSRFLCEGRAIRETEVLIYEALLTRFKKESDIQFAFDRSPGLDTRATPDSKNHDWS